jgi:sterol desaturase/sphingolipid hydroxylase (fatty acid hydroxylase superfamily)
MTYGMHQIVFISINLAMTFIYLAKIPFFEQFKVNDKGWPWTLGDKPRGDFINQIKKTLKVLAVNHIVLAPILYILGYGSAHKYMKSAIGEIPPWYYIPIQLLGCMMIEDTMFYWVHRALHHPLLYGRCHKIHHEYKTTIGIASEYAHPIEYVIADAIPFTTGPLLLGLHYYVFWMWMVLRVGETVDGHCGYDFPWSPYRLLPFSGSADVHDFHHSHNMGNFATFFTYWDDIMGTSAEYHKYLKKRADRDKSH